MAGDFGSGAAGAVLNAISALSGLFSGKIDKHVKRALDGMRLTMAVAFGAVAAFMSKAGTVDARHVGIFRAILDGALLPILRTLDTWIKKTHGWLEKTLGPILRTLNKYRKLLLKLYDKWLRPIFDTIDVIRHVLQLLSFLHVDVARKIDQKLAAFENWVSEKFGFVLRELNKLIDVTQLVIDEGGFYQRYTYARSLIKYARESWNALLHPQLTGLDAEENAQRKKQTVAPLEPRVLVNQVSEYYTTGGGELAPFASVYIAAFNASANDV